MLFSQALWDAGFGGERGRRWIILQPHVATRLPPMFHRSGEVHLGRDVSPSAIRALWTALPKEPRIRRVYLNLYKPTQQLMNAIIESLREYVPHTLEIFRNHVPWPSASTDIRMYMSGWAARTGTAINRKIHDLYEALAKVPDLILKNWHMNEIAVFLGYLKTPCSLTLERCHLDDHTVEQVAELVASGTLRHLWLVHERDGYDHIRLACALADPRCVLESIGLSCDRGFFFFAQSAPSIRHCSFHFGPRHRTTRPQESTTISVAFLKRLQGVRHLSLRGRIEGDISELFETVNGMTGTLRRLLLDIGHPHLVTDFCTRILTREENCLVKLGISGPRGEEVHAPEFIAALQLRTCQLRRLELGNGMKLHGLEEALPKTLLCEVYAWLRSSDSVLAQLHEEWFRILEVLLSAGIIPRISVAAKVRMLPISDLVPRIAATLGWPLKRSQTYL
jgi:hypothetical protein